VVLDPDTFEIIEDATQAIRSEQPDKKLKRTTKV